MARLGRSAEPEPFRSRWSAAAAAVEQRAHGERIERAAKRERRGESRAKERERFATHCLVSCETEQLHLCSAAFEMSPDSQKRKEQIEFMALSPDPDGRGYGVPDHQIPVAAFAKAAQS